MEDKKPEPHSTAAEIFKAVKGREPGPGELVALTGKEADAFLAEPSGMRLADYKIGESFWTPTGEWRCTDIGTRVITAIKLDQADPRNYNGPPYSIVEEVFDEYDMEGCYPTQEVMIEELGEVSNASSADVVTTADALRDATSEEVQNAAKRTLEKHRKAFSRLANS